MSIYKQLQVLTLEEQIELLTKHLVSFNRINGTGGEASIIDELFLSIHETDEELKLLLENFPKWEQLYPLPYETIRKLNIPSINMGGYGKDGHKWTERVYKPYSFSVLPVLIRNTTIQILNEYKAITNKQIAQGL
ncbi:hypothetical protein [Bacillus paramycoides]|uniref:hypothetical protein n=1 Tax=Bacillus paramycoides TaxID=2026194 RepID=UPI002684B1C0